MVFRAFGAACLAFHTRLRGYSLAMRVCLITLLIVCGCNKEEQPTPSGNASAEPSKVAPQSSPAPASDYINIKKPPPRDGVLDILKPKDGGAFASLTGSSDFSSSGGVSVRRVSVKSRASVLISPCFSPK